MTNTCPGLRIVAGIAASVALTGVGAAQANAQIRGSEKGSVSQTLDRTTIRVEYSRPSARGRELFGGLVPWDVTWTPGANWATTLETDKDIRINGTDVEADAYSVWMSPHEGPWTLTLNAKTDDFHFQKPDTAEGRYNVEIDPETAPHMEMLTWSFPAVAGDAATLVMHWGETRVPLQILVEPTEPVVLSAVERGYFLGRYDLEIAAVPGWPEGGELRITGSDDGTLRGWMPFPVHPGDALTFDLIPAGLNRFSPGLYRDGELFNIEAGVTFEFAMAEDGTAESLVLRAIEGSALATGVRTEEQAASR